ncbi:hypothetical protein K456DRAFT_57818 [Colletotrichum gloeosporioides 23]|nr:hypothetical protein K456DRAFT_57818 [Colletotrichum gloeosporioides 23]
MVGACAFVVANGLGSTGARQDSRNATQTKQKKGRNVACSVNSSQQRRTGRVSLRWQVAVYRSDVTYGQSLNARCKAAN